MWGYSAIAWTRYSRFSGDYEGMQYRYFEFADSFFVRRWWQRCAIWRQGLINSGCRIQYLAWFMDRARPGDQLSGNTAQNDDRQKPKISGTGFCNLALKTWKRTVQEYVIVGQQLENHTLNNARDENHQNSNFGVVTGWHSLLRIYHQYCKNVKRHLQKVFANSTLS